MVLRRIAWILIIVASAAAYLFSNGTVTLAVLAALAAIPLVSAVMLALSGRRLNVEIHISENDAAVKSTDPADAEAGNLSAVQKIMVHFNNESIIPIAWAETEISAKNFRTGETFQSRSGCSIGPRGNADTEAGFSFAHAGRCGMSAGSIIIYDPLRLFWKRISAVTKTEFTKHPKHFEMILDLGSSSSAILESDKYSRARQGNDPGEVRSIREYVPGDPVKNIHWKLSEKMDKLLVKELSLPVSDDLLVVHGTCGNGADYDQMDACAAVFASVISAATAEGHSLSACWADPRKDGAVIRKISTETQAHIAEDEYMACPAAGGLGAVRTVLTDGRYAHIVIVGSEVPGGISELASGSRITALVCGSAGSGGTDGIVVTGFDKFGYESTLSCIEI